MDTTLVTTTDTWITMSEIYVGLLGVLGTILVSVISSFLTYRYTRKTRLESEWRIDKLRHYRELLTAYSMFVNAITDKELCESKIAIANAANTLSLVAPQGIIATFTHLSNAINNMSNDKSPQADELAKERLKQLVLEIRRDLMISPPDDPKSFLFVLFSATKKAEQK